MMNNEPVIEAIGTYIPSRKESNFDLLDQFSISKEFITKKIGVHKRPKKDNDEETSDLCVKAFHDLKEKVALDLVELVCVVTQNPDKKIPHTAAIVHQKLGLGNSCMTFDISQGCAGYPHGLAIVTSLMKRFNIKKAILFTCDPYSKIVDPNDKNTVLLFGDAATATLITNDPNMSGYYLEDSLFGIIPNSNSCLECEDKLFMSGRDIVNNALKAVPGHINTLLEKASLNKNDIDLFIFHQASKLMIETLIKLMLIDVEKAPFDIESLGNTVSSSIPIVLSKYTEQQGKNIILLSGFGVGFSYGSIILKLKNKG